jgi:hypothetical protein
VSRLAIKNLLGPEKLHLDLGCSRLVLQNGKSAMSDKLSVPLKPGIQGSESLADLRTTLVNLCAEAPSGKRTLEISLSDAVARSWIVERRPGLASGQEIEALAGDQMRHLYGDNDADSGDWVIRLDATPFASRWPAIALPRLLLDLLVDIAVTQGWQLARIQTRFVQRLNAERSNLLSRQKFVVYSLDTPDGLTIGIRNTQEWLALRTHPPLALLDTQLPVMLRRDCRAVGVSLDDCRLQALHWPANEVPA